MEVILFNKFITQHIKQFRLRGKGMPILSRSVIGDLYIRIVSIILFQKDKINFRRI